MLAAAMTRQLDATPWMIRGFDLKNAYRQCAVSPKSSNFAYIVAGDPSCEKFYAFRMRALPFGSVRSVHSFLRVAMCSQQLVVDFINFVFGDQFKLL